MFSPSCALRYLSFFRCPTRPRFMLVYFGVNFYFIFRFSLCVCVQFAYFCCIFSVTFFSLFMCFFLRLTCLHFASLLSFSSSFSPSLHSFFLRCSQSFSLSYFLPPFFLSNITFSPPSLPLLQSLFLMHRRDKKEKKKNETITRRSKKTAVPPRCFLPRRGRRKSR